MAQHNGLTPEERSHNDRLLLWNGATATAAHRAFVADRLRPSVNDLKSPDASRSLALEAFQQYMLAQEDTLTWFFVLLEWQPTGDDSTSILALLDTIQIGRKVKLKDYTESALLDKLNSMTAEDLRVAIRFPSSEQIHAQSDWPLSINSSLDQHLELWLQDLRRIATSRLQDDRARVRAYNKSKHGLLGIFGSDDSGDPAIVLMSSSSGYKASPVTLSRVFLRALPGDIEFRLNRTVQILSGLQTMLALALGVYFGEWIAAPQWAANALTLQGWVPSGPPAVA